MNNYEEFVKTTDFKVDADDDIQFYLDGMNEEHGEIFGVIKRMRRGDYDDLTIDSVTVSKYLIKYGLKNTIIEFDKPRGDLLKEIGDEHWYLTRFLQVIGISWNQIKLLNMEKLKKRVSQNKIIGSGSYRENHVSK